MSIRIFFQQLRRNSSRTWLNILLLAAAIAFFVMSLNLHQNSVRNIQEAEDAYSTIAVMEIYGDIDKYGNLAEPYSEEHVGYKSVAVKGFDFSEVVNAPGVIDWDLRAKYAAYIEGEIAMELSDMVSNGYYTIRFTLAEEEPVEVPISWKWEGNYDLFQRLTTINVIELYGCYVLDDVAEVDLCDVSLYRDKEVYAEQVKRLNRSEETEKVILYPDIEYVVSSSYGSEWVHSAEHPGKLKYSSPILSLRPYLAPIHHPYGGIDYYVDYSGSTEGYMATSGAAAGQPFPIQRWEDVQNDPALKQYFEEDAAALKIQHSTFNVCLTKDMTGVPTYHLGGASLHSGRVITPEEYDTGAKVCMVSKQQANLQNWKVGDKLTMQFYNFEAFPNNNTEFGTDQAIYHKNTGDFFYENTYEIVGIYDQTPTTGNSGIARSTLSMPWNTIYIPHNAVKNTKPEAELPVHGALLTIWLENGSVDAFLADMEAKGFTETREGQYNTTFTFYDQGYSQVRPGLEAMRSTARLLLTLSSVLLAVTVILMAYFFAQSFKQSVGIFRMLGGRKASAIYALLVCALVVTLAGAAIGGLTGQALAQGVGIEILKDNIARSEMNAIFQAFVLNRDEPIELSVQANALLTVKAACVAFAFPAAMLFFVSLYIKKEPRALLPKGET